MSTNQNSNNNIDNNSQKEGLSLTNFFALNNEISIEHPYKFNEHIQELSAMNDSRIIESLKFFIPREHKNTFVSDNISFPLSSVVILTSKLSNDNELNLVKLIDMSDYLDKTKPKMKLKFVEYNEKKELIIKSRVDFTNFTMNLFENMCKKSKFKTAERATMHLTDKYKELEEDLSDNEKALKCEFDMEIKVNSINRIDYTNEDEFLIDLQFPPTYKTNFLIEDTHCESVKKKEYETVLFPFRNFQDEIANLKYRRFFILFKKDNQIQKNKDDFENNNETILGSLQLLLNSSKIRHITQNFHTLYQNEKELKIKFNLNEKMELCDYFSYSKNDSIKGVYERTGFLSPESKLPDLNIIIFNYQTCALISENLLTYYNAIEFVSKLELYQKTIFSCCTKEEFPILFNETLTRILDSFQNMGTEFTLSAFEQKLQEKFELLYSDYKNKGLDYITRPSRNKTLLRIQRVIVTPTYTLFTPYVLDQGNRILREFIIHPFLSMICVFKMDDFNEGRWNNKFLIEFIKYFLSRGIFFDNRNFTFFDFSQSQFRNMSCWLLTNPDEILPQTGDYSKIKIVAKYGARISQTLTTTRKTIQIKRENIKFIDDVVIRDPITNKIKYTFSDGVGKISYPLAKKIAECIHLKYTPSAFQGRFLGCKGVWTTMFNDHSESIYIRPSQNKFTVSITDVQFFELCDYSRYIQAYLNRQIILLLSALHIQDKIFINKLDDYRNSLEDEKFVLSLVHYEEWNSMFRNMYLNGVTMKNDRLVKTLVDTNKDILYTDLKNKARIYIKDSAYVIGIMDEYRVLEYGEAYLHIKRRNFDLILNQYCSVAKCPCLHPGDIRKLKFVSYIPGKEETYKYKVFEKYTNVIIFPQKGHRPHPNEISGSDLDGDCYFIFYDKDLIPENTVEPMNYNIDPTKIKEKKKITLKHIIKYFAEYINLNNLGLIGDAHLAMSDKDKNGADGVIPRRIALKFSRAVDAPKTGDRVELSEEETPKNFPHYMEKKNKSYISKKILGQLYDKIEDYKRELINQAGNKFCEGEYFDEDLVTNDWENYGFLAMVFYKEYFEEMVKLLKKNEIKSESLLLTGNSVDNEYSVFSKKKHNYDLRERVASHMVEIFRKFHQRFNFGLKFIFTKFNESLFGTINDELFFKNSYHHFASACYRISYDFRDIIDHSDTYLSLFQNNFTDEVLQSLDKPEEDNNSIDMISEYESDTLGLDSTELYFDNYNEVLEEKEIKREKITQIINSFNITLNNFVNTCKRSYKIPKTVNEDNQYRILSFPWCLCGKLLSKMKYSLN